MVMEPAILVSLGGALLAGGTAFGGVRYGLNGMREGMKRIESKLDKVEEQTSVNRVDIARLEASCDR